MNKGILKATGELVGLINSDDFYSDNTSIENIVTAYQNNNSPDVLYGNMKFLIQKQISLKSYTHQFQL